MCPLAGLGPHEPIRAAERARAVLSSTGKPHSHNLSYSRYGTKSTRVSCSAIAMFFLVVFATAYARKDPAANKSAFILIAKTWASSCMCTFGTFSHLDYSTDSF
ncbi:hypothetical protein Y032_0717g1791 [Ancylostoma ceylanicum]|uniref:Uncharacterized protein n=1 Tax=Ancylostoma ceylanicum TaxID=53326 RepID=A0A016WFP2_9BILA|nr:hypothetical protein Y032_0717g1791 [Ancylostoma ceylanicum]